jgi:hypothetical protein
MKANELRIKNYVEVNGKVEQMHFICEEEPAVSSIEYGAHVLSWRDISPIPITEEWLTRFGFWQWGSYTHLWKVNRDTGLKITIRSRPLRKRHHGCDYELNNNHSIGIKHVHQLQNLYYALTGEELTLTK